MNTVIEALKADPSITLGQRRTLIMIYESFQKSSGSAYPPNSWTPERRQRQREARRQR